MEPQLLFLATPRGAATLAAALLLVPELLPLSVGPRHVAAFLQSVYEVPHPAYTAGLALLQEGAGTRDAHAHATAKRAAPRRVLTSTAPRPLICRTSS